MNGNKHAASFLWSGGAIAWQGAAALAAATLMVAGCASDDSTTTSRSAREHNTLTSEQATRYRRAALLLDEEDPVTYLQRDGVFAQDRVTDTRVVTTREPERRTEPVVAQTRTEPARTRTPSNALPVTSGNDSVASLAFPTGDRATSAILLELFMPREVMKGQEFDYEYHVENLTNVELQNVVLTVQGAENLQIISADPRANSGSSEVFWTLGSLAPRETKVIQVRAEADAVGNASNCVTVSYNNSLCAGVVVVDPALQLVKTATPRELVCNEFNLTYRVCNTGTGSATNVVIRDTLPTGVTIASSGARAVEIPVGDLAAGDCRDFNIQVRAAQVGTYASPARASADNNLSADAQRVETVIVQPALTLICESPERQYTGRNVTYTYRLTNEGDIPASNAVVTIGVPTGAEFVRASEGGVMSSGRVAFNAGSLAAGASREFTVIMNATASGDVELAAQATADCAEPVTTRCTTAFRGIPAILLEVVDLVDPVEVGGETTYVIAVTNQGTAPDTDIEIVCTLPDALEYVSSTGATQASVRGKTVTFAPVPRLDAKQRVEWRMIVRAISEADARFAVEMNSHELTTPVRETEATNTYQ